MACILGNMPLATVSDIWLPDGTVLRGSAAAGFTGCQTPRFWTAPPRHREKEPDCLACQNTGYRSGCGNYQSTDLLEWAASFDYDLDEWQRWWLTEACGTKPDGRWTAFEAVSIAPRQNGKNAKLEVRELGGLYVLGESMIIHTAHEFKAAAEHFRRVRDTVTNYDELSRRVKAVTTSHGDEAIELRPVPTLIFGPGGKQVRRRVSARLRFLARSRGSGRAFTADCVVYDEAMILSDDQVSASMPTMSAIPNPQMIYTASAGLHDSVQLAMIRRRVLRGDQTLFGAEWSIDPHLDTCPRDELRGRKANHYIVCGLHDDRDDPRSWAKANPALGIRISYEHVRKEFAAMSATGFDRERLGVGDWPDEEESWSVVSEEQWEACAMPDPGGTVRPIAFAVDVNPEMTVATIAAAWERPETVMLTDEQMVALMQATATAGLPLPSPSPAQAQKTYRAVLEIPRGCSREGTAWIVPRLAELKKRWRPCAIVLPKNGPAASLADTAEQAGIEVLAAGSADEAAAFALMVTGIRNRRVIHLGKELAPTLWSAIASADTRDIGDGGRGWCRRTSEDDISPVTAVTLAYWGLNKKRRSYDVTKSIRLGAHDPWLSGCIVQYICGKVPGCPVPARQAGS